MSNGSVGDTFTRTYSIWPWHWHQASTLYIMWPMHLQCLKLLRPTVKEEMHFQEIAIFVRWPSRQGHTKCCPVPYTSRDLCTYKVRNCWWRSRCIYKKIQYCDVILTLGSRPDEMFPCTLYIMWPMHLKSLKLLRPKLEEMHLKINTIIDLDLSLCHMRYYPVPSTLCDLCSYKVWSCYTQWFRRSCIYKKLQYLTFWS